VQRAGFIRDGVEFGAELTTKTTQRARTLHAGLIQAFIARFAKYSARLEFNSYWPIGISS
jgi:hypothetical protein